MTNEPKTIAGSTGIWACKIGETKAALPAGADAPMRAAVERAYRELTGEQAAFTISGWSAELTEGERAVVENRLPQSPNTAPAELPEALPRYREYMHLRTTGAWSSGVPAWARDYSGCMNDMTAAHAVIEELHAQVEALSAAQAGVPAEAPLPLLVRDIAADLNTTPIQVCKALAELGFGGHSVNMAVTPQMARSLRSHFAAAPQPSPYPAPGDQWVEPVMPRAWMQRIDAAAEALSRIQARTALGELEGPASRALQGLRAIQSSASPAPAQQGQDGEREYYYRVDDCKAQSSESSDCICWHKEETGPLATDVKAIKSWRAARAAPQPASDRTVSHKAQAIPGVQWQCGQQANGFTAAPAAGVVRVCPECDIAGCRHMRTAPAVAPAPAAQGDALARRLFDAGWKAAARYCGRDDVVADGIIGPDACPQFQAEFAAALAAQHADLGATAEQSSVEQEPVAWRWKYKFRDIGETGAYEYHSHDFAVLNNMPHGEPLYLHPALQPDQIQAAVEAEQAEDARDAARYRQVRRGQKWSVINGVGDTLRAEVLDSEVDAAMAGDKEGCE